MSSVSAINFGQAPSIYPYAYGNEHQQPTAPQQEAVYPPFNANATNQNVNNLSHSFFNQPANFGQYPVTFNQEQPYYYPPMPVITSQMQRDTNKLLEKAGEIASSTVSNNRSTERQETQREQTTSAPVFIDLSRRDYNILSSRTEVHHHHHHGDNNTERENENGTRALAIILGTIVAGVSAYFFGKFMAQNDDRQDDQDSFDSLKTKWFVNRNVYQQNRGEEYCEHIDNAIEKADWILAKQKTDRTHNIALAVLFLSTGLTAVVGGVVGSSALMATALVTGVAGSIFGLYKLGYACFSTKEQRAGEALQQELNAVVNR